MKKLLAEILVVIIFMAAAVAHFADSLPLLNERFLGGADQDAGLYVWLVRSFLSAPLTALQLESSAFYPYGLSRAWSDNFLLPSALAAFFHLLGCTDALSYNLLILGAIFLNGWCTYLLGRTFGARSFSSLASGIIFQSSGYLWTNLGHPQLQFAFFMPLTMLLSILAVRSNRFVWWIIVGLSVSAAFLTTVYFAVFSTIIALMVLFTTLFILPMDRPFHAVGKCAAGMTLGMLILLPWISPYLEVQKAFDARHLYETFYFSASALSYVTFSPLNRWYSFSQNWSHPEGQLGSSVVLLVALFASMAVAAVRSTYRSWFTWSFLIFAAISIFSSNPIEGFLDRLFASLCTWIFVVISVLFFYRLRKDRTGDSLGRYRFALLFSLGILFFFLSLGPLGNPSKGEPAFSFFVPFYYLVPGVDSLRAVARYGIVVTLIVSISLPLLFESILKNAILRNSALLVIAIAAVLEGIPSAYPLEEMAPAPAIVARLNQQSEAHDAAIFLPLADQVSGEGVRSWGEFARLNTRYMNWTLDTPGSIVNGYSGQRSKLMLELPGLLREFPSPRSLDALSGIAGLRYIVVSPELWTSRSAQEIEKRISNYGDRLELLEKDESGNLLLRLNPIFRISAAQPSFSLLIPSKCSLQLESVEEPGKKPILSWAAALRSDPRDLNFALSRNATTARDGFIPSAGGSGPRVRPRILAVSPQNATTVKTTSVCGDIPK